MLSEHPAEAGMSISEGCYKMGTRLWLKPINQADHHGIWLFTDKENNGIQIMNALMNTGVFPNHRPVSPPVYVILSWRHSAEVGNIYNLLEDHGGSEVLRGRDDCSRSLIHPSECSCNSKGAFHSTGLTVKRIWTALISQPNFKTFLNERVKGILL